MENRICGILGKLLNHHISKQDAVNRLMAVNYVMPELSDFKARRKKLHLTLEQVKTQSGIAKSTISRIENGNEAQYRIVRKLHEFYVRNGV